MRPLLVIACLVVLAGCETEPPLPTAVRQNIAAQTVHPGAPGTHLGISMNGQRAQAGEQRYLDGKIIVPVDPNTSNQSQGGGGSGGSSSSSGSN
jgi:hypothetical protein